MKTKLLLTIALAFWGLSANAQTPNWLWAKNAGGNSNDGGNNVATDENGFTYVTGFFSSSTIAFGSDTLTNAGSNDVFIVKYDSLGNVLWAKSAGGSGDDKGYGIATDKNGDVYVTGNFASSSIIFGTITLTSIGFFIAKYDANGNALWAKDAGGTVYHNIGGNCIATDTSGNVCVTGSFPSSLTFGITTLTNAGNPDIYVAKYDASGNVLWAKQGNGGTGDYNSGGGIATDVSGNIYITGFCGANTNFSGALWGIAGIYIVKYNSSGTVQWVVGPQGSGGGVGSGITVDASGGVYVTGWFTDASLTFGGSTNATNANPGNSDILLVTYGNPSSAWSVGGSGNDEGYGITTDKNGNIYVTGMFQSSSITFPISTILTNTNPGKDIFVVKYPSGLYFNVASWAKSAGGIGDDLAQSISVDAVGNSYVTGDFGYSPIFDNDTLTSAGVQDVFTARLGCSPLQPGSITGNTNICRNSSHSYSINSVSGATSYTWNLPPGWSGSSTSTSITATADSTNGTISVTANNSCGSSKVRTLFVTVNPPTPTITASGATIFCQGDSVILTASSANSYLWSNGATSQGIIVLTAGNYAVTITDVNGCSASSLVISVTVNPNPPVPTITQSGSLLASSTPTGNQWYQNDTLISGATGQVYIPADTGIYTITVTDTNGCSSTSLPYSFPPLPIGMGQYSGNNSLSIFPNPTTGTLTIENNSGLGIEKIEIYNMLGQKVIAISNNKRQTSNTIDVHSLTTGVYTVQIITNKGVINKQVAVEKSH